jgi:hypothetical protein
LGLLAVGALIAVCLFLLLYEARVESESAARVIAYVLFVPLRDGRLEDDLLPVRVGMVFLPVGLMTCWSVGRRGLKKRELGA